MAFRDRHEICWEIVVAEDGEVALQLLFTEEVGSAPLPDLILLDWNLPKVSGVVVLERLKEHSKLRKIPVLVHAAYGRHANGYVTKPETLDLLKAMVETIERFWCAVQLPKVARIG